MQHIWIGTSGWVYKHWAENFYPEDWPKKEQFEYYSSQFPTVEVNATFYRLPTTKMVKNWSQKAPARFLFAVKGSRFITHIKRLKNITLGLKKYFTRIAPLNDHLGPILWQLPPNFENKPENQQRVREFIEKLPEQFRHAVEFRHPSWITDSTFGMLREKNIANVWLSSNRMPMNCEMTANFVYLRFHGLRDGPAHDYSKTELQPWADRLEKAAKAGKSCYVYFNNDLNTRAPLNAKMLMELVKPFSIEAFRDKPTFLNGSRSRPVLRSRHEPRSKRLHRE